MPDSPVVAKLELAHRMREYREASGETARAVSSRLGFSPNYLSALEHGREVLSPDKLPDLREVYELTAGELRELGSLIETSKVVGWWEQSPYSELLTDQMKLLCGLEQGATSALVFESVVVTGLLQSEDYAGALIAADVSNSRATLRRRIEIRLKRQERLYGDDPLELAVVMSEAALMQQIGGKAVLRGQLEHLADAIESLADSLSVRIQSFESSEPALVGASTVVTFEVAQSRLQSVVWLEAAMPVGISDDDPELEAFLREELDRALAGSLSREESLSLIRSRIAALS